MTFRRSLIFKFFIVCGALLAISVGLVASIKPTEIAAFLQSRLSQALRRPVTVGQAQFNFSRGITFEVRDIGIGTLEENGERLEIPSLFVKPRVLPLFVGRLAVAELRCESPLLVLDINHRKEENAEAPPERPNQALDLPFQTIDLANGTLRITDSSGVRLKTPLVIEKVQGYFRVTAEPFRARFSVAGELNQGGQVCPWSFKGHVSPPEDKEGWAENTLHFEADLGKFRPGVLLKNAPLMTFVEDSGGSFQVRIRARGIPAKGVEVETRLTGEGFTLVPGNSGGKSISLEEAHFKTRWVHTPRGEFFDNIDLAVNKVSLGGVARLEKKENTQHLKVELSSPIIPLDRILALYPAFSFFPESATSKPEGSVQVNALTYDGPLSAQLPDILAGVGGQMTFSHGRLPFPDTDGIQDLHFEMNLADNRLSLENGYLSCMEIPLYFQGWSKTFFLPT